MTKVINGSVVAANAFITTHQNVMSKKDVKRYVGMIQKKVNHKSNYFVGPYDETVFMKQFDFIFTYDMTHKNIIIPVDVSDNKVLKGYFRKKLDKEFIDILDSTGQQFLGIEKQKQMVKKRV
jgi:hypothetical protein